MNKSELIESLATQLDISKAQASRTLNTVLETITGAVAAGDSVSISGFGVFSARERNARTGRNPQTGEEMHIEARKAPHFKPGSRFKELVNQ